MSIRSDGSVDSIEILRPSGSPVLDRAAERIVRMASPYGAFPGDIRKDTDILVITRTWRFAPGDQLSKSVLFLVGFGFFFGNEFDAPPLLLPFFLGVFFTPLF